MRHEKVFDRPDGSKVMVTAELTVDYLRDEYRWSATIATKGKRKRTWLYNQHDKATSEEIQDTKLELWNIIKPKQGLEA